MSKKWREPFDRPQGYSNKSSLARRSRDTINGTIGPGNPVILPSGITTVVVKRKRYKPGSEQSKHQHFQNDPSREYGKVDAHGVKRTRNGFSATKPEHLQMWKRRKNRPGKKTDVEHIKALNGSLARPAKGPLRKHKRNNAHLDWSVL